MQHGGDQEFSIVVQYIEGDQIETIKISDWCADSCFGERIVWKGILKKEQMVKYIQGLSMMQE